jgi:catechol 2,3-dioxygenase-like lactoylglutathione lyase family enzyme
MTQLDHVVLWVEDPLRSVGFYQEVVGLTGVRVDEFRAGAAPFPSVRVSPDTLLDLMARAAAPFVIGLTGGEAGFPVNHVCLAMSREDYHRLAARLDERGIAKKVMARNFGARGVAPESFYFRDPDGNVLEARYYD